MDCEMMEAVPKTGILEIEMCDRPGKIRPGDLVFPTGS
jgi:hypothetical protein